MATEPSESKVRANIPNQVSQLDAEISLAMSPNVLATNPHLEMGARTTSYARTRRPWPTLGADGGTWYSRTRELFRNAVQPHGRPLSMWSTETSQL